MYKKTRPKVQNGLTHNCTVMTIFVVYGIKRVLKHIWQILKFYFYITFLEIETCITPTNNYIFAYCYKKEHIKLDWIRSKATKIVREIRNINKSLTVAFVAEYIFVEFERNVTSSTITNTYKFTWNSRAILHSTYSWSKTNSQFGRNQVANIHVQESVPQIYINVYIYTYICIYIGRFFFTLTHR